MCSKQGCERRVVSRGMCAKHYNRWHRANREPQPSCKIDGCERERWARGYCAVCYQRWWKNNSAEQRLRAPAGSGHLSKKTGYREIWVDGKMRREHRVVMERVLGRPLRADEQVHHRNGERADNRPENLELWTTSHPYGQRVDDVLAWARTIVERYS